MRLRSACVAILLAGSSVLLPSSTALTNGIVDIEVYDAADVRVGQQTWTGQNIAVGVFGPAYSPNLHWNSRAASLTVIANGFDTAAGATPAKVAPGVTSTITTTVTNTGGALDNAIVDVEVYNSAGVRVAQQFWSGQALLNGVTQTQTYTYGWVAPATLGTYTVKVGVFGAGWNPTYKWNANADQVVVANPAFTSTAAVSASTVAPNGVVDITGTFTNTGGEMAAGNVDLEV